MVVLPLAGGGIAPASVVEVVPAPPRLSGFNASGVDPEISDPPEEPVASPLTSDSSLVFEISA